MKFIQSKENPETSGRCIGTTSGSLILAGTRFFVRLRLLSPINLYTRSTRL